MKTKDELNTLKEEHENLNNNFEELSDEELKHVVGGVTIPPVLQGTIAQILTADSIGAAEKPSDNPSST